VIKKLITEIKVDDITPELVRLLAALPDKTVRVVKSPGPWDGLNEPNLIHENRS